MKPPPSTLDEPLRRADLGWTFTEALQRLWYAREPSGPLAPFAPLLELMSRAYARGLEHDQHRAREHRRYLPAFVISVGNVVVGGTGKTPFALWLARHLHGKGLRPAILSRGHGRKTRGVVRVGGSRGEALDVSRFGDEPILLAAKASPVPVWVGRERWAAGKAAIESDGADVLILDDGFQHLKLHRDLDFTLLDAHRPFGNGRLLPAGPLREPTSHIQRAHAFLLTRAEDPDLVRETRNRLHTLCPGKPLFVGRHRLTAFKAWDSPQRILPERLAGASALAFAGIAHPEAFFRSLEASGIQLLRGIPFADHHAYGGSEIQTLMREARLCRASLLLTTEKDLVRIPERFRGSVLAAELELELGGNEQTLCEFIESRMDRWKGGMPIP